MTIALRPPEIVLSLSSQFANDASTTAQLSAPGGKTTSDFNAGRILESTNPGTAVDILSGDYTELEWSLTATNATQYGDIYQFRVTVNGTPLTTYSVTPQWTIEGNLEQVHYRWRNDDGPELAAANIGIDDISSGTCGLASTLNLVHTVSASATNTLLLVGVSIKNDADETVASVVWKQGDADAHSLTLVGVADNGNDARVEIWKLVAPNA
jgi:hypothetical protein